MEGAAKVGDEKCCCTNGSERNVCNQRKTSNASSPVKSHLFSALEPLCLIREKKQKLIIFGRGRELSLDRREKGSFY